MNMTLAQSIQEQVTRKDLLALAAFHDEHANAISFYFSTPVVQDRSHAEEMNLIKELGYKLSCDHEKRQKSELRKNIEAVLSKAKEARLGTSGLSAIFACHSSNFWQEFELPTRCSAGLLEVGTRFHLLPLVRGMEECAPYCILIVENGRARCFVAHGETVREISAGLPRRRAQERETDSRVGWSHHIEGHDRERAQEYLRNLVDDIQKVLARERLDRLVIGCRDELWSALESILTHNLSATVLGHFHLPGFDLSAAEFLHAARNLFDAYRTERAKNILQRIHEDSRHGAIGTDAVHRAANAGRIQILLVNSPNKLVIEHETSEDNRRADDQRETIIRKALLSGADVVFAEDSAGLPIEGFAALLRY